MTTEFLDKTMFSEYSTRLPTFKRYGFIVNQDDSVTDGTAKVRYLYDAYGKTPAGLDSSNNFSFGDWEDFCEDICKPVVLNADGTIEYELDHTDQTKRIDGTASDYDSTSTTYNFMSQFRKMYISITKPTSSTLKVVFCDAKLDETYNAYAFTDEKGRIKDFAYMSMFNGINSNSKIRSLKSSSQAIYSTSGATMRSYCQANGIGWDFPSYSLWDHIQWLLVLISKSLDVKTKFGKGNISGGQNNPSLPGALISTGMFSGTVANETSPVKTFYVENMWGNSWNWVNGLLSYNGNYWLKPTPPYTNSSLKGYKNVGAKPASGSYGAIKSMAPYMGLALCDSTSGTDYSKWYCSRFYNGNGSSDATVRTALIGGCRFNGSSCSVFSVALDSTLTYSDWNVSCRLSFL